VVYAAYATVTDLGLNNGPITGGTVVTVVGTGLTAPGGCLFGTVPSATFAITSSTELVCTAPAASAAGGVTLEAALYDMPQSRSNVQFYYTSARACM
jgi:hypothetical protein